MRRKPDGTVPRKVTKAQRAKEIAESVLGTEVAVHYVSGDADTLEEVVRLVVEGGGTDNGASDGIRRSGRGSMTVRHEPPTTVWLGVTEGPGAHHDDCRTLNRILRTMDSRELGRLLGAEGWGPEDEVVTQEDKT